MNTQAIATFIAAAGTESTKSPSRDAGKSDTPFNQILNREMADRQKNDATSATSVKDTQQAGKQESKAAEKIAASKEISDAEKYSDTPTAEQILMMAAQFNQATQMPQTETGKALPTPGIDGVEAVTTLPTQGANPLLSTENAATDVASGSAQTNAKRDNSANAFSDMIDKVAAEKGMANQGANREGDTLTADSVTDTAKDFSALTRQADIEISAKTSIDAPDTATVITPLQQAATALTDKVAGNNANHIPSQIGSSAWNDAVGQKIVWMLGNEEQTASLTLNPPDLGPMHVVLSVSSTHANASFYSPHAEVRDALEAALPKLREMLGDAGLQLGQADVNAGSPQQQNNFAATSGSGSSGVSTIETSATPAASINTPHRIVRDGLVDTFA